MLGFNMFAYCGNNPVNYVDPTGESLLAFLIVTVFVVTCTVALTGCSIDVPEIDYAEQNNLHNSQLDSNESTTSRNRTIDNQHGEIWKSFRCGAYPVSRNGCEVIAVHNAKVLKGLPSTLSGTISSFHANSAIFGDGFFGSNPFAIGTVLDSEGISYSSVGLSQMNKSGVYIISYWNTDSIFDGVHTIAIQYDGTTYKAYNYHWQEGSIDISQFKGRYICGYYLG